MRRPRRNFLASLSGAAAALALPRAVRAAGSGVVQADWMRALCRELNLIGPADKEMAPEQLARLLAAPSSVELDADALAMRSAGIRDEKKILQGSAPERWLTAGDKPGVVIFRTLIRRPGRHLIRLRVRGGPHLVSFGTQETRPIDSPPEARNDSVQQLSGVWLKSGWLELAVALAPGGAVERMIVHPEAGSPIAPPGGWHPDQPLTLGSKAATLARMARWENELPASEAGPTTLPIIGGFDHEGRSLRKVRVDQPGVYSLAVRVSGIPPPIVFFDETQLFLSAGLGGVRIPSGLGTVASLGTFEINGDDHDLTFEGNSGAIYELLHLKRVANDYAYLNLARSHGFELGALASEKSSALVTAAALGQNSGALRSFLVGPLSAQAKAARRVAPLPPPPQRPAAVSPVLPDGEGPWGK